MAPRTVHAARGGIVELDGNALRRHRHRRDLTQRQLAALAGLGDTAGHATVYRLERARTRTTWQTAHDLARALRIPIADLIGPNPFGMPE